MLPLCYFAGPEYSLITAVFTNVFNACMLSGTCVYVCVVFVCICHSTYIGQRIEGLYNKIPETKFREIVDTPKENIG